MLPLKGLRKGGILRGTDTPEIKISNKMFEDLLKVRKEGQYLECAVCV